MTLAKSVVRGLLIAGVAASTARGGSMLVLGVVSGDWPPTPTQAAPTSTRPSAPTPALRLGVYSDPGPSVFAASVSSPAYPVMTPSPAVAEQVVTMPSPLVVAPPTPTPSATPTPAPSPAGYDAFINLGLGPYANSDTLTTGNPQPWYLGPQVDRLFGGVPGPSQQAAFAETVLARVRQTFQLGGIPVSLTDDPNAPAAHTISVVSRTSNPSLGNVLGMSYVGGNGFQYVDTAANSAKSVDQLEWIVAHNLAHELMLAFGVPEVHDQSGQYVDSRNIGLAMISNPAATFSPDAVADLLSRDFRAANGSILYPAAQVLDASTVPEPSTVLFWAAIGSASWFARRAGRRPVAPDRSLNLP